MQKQEEEKKQEAEKLAAISVNTPFNQEQMIHVWNKYIQTITDKTILKNTMETCKPTLSDNYRLIQSVENSYQKNEMNNELVSLLNFLRVELKNGLIELETRVKAVEENARILTPNERFKKLMETYPELAKMKDEFGLEIQLT